MVIYLYRLLVALILLLLSSCIDDPISSTISDNYIASITKSDEFLFLTRSDGRVMKSVDGREWTSLPLNNNLILLDIESTNSGYVIAVGDNGVIQTSTDNGSSWNRRSSGIFTFLKDVVIYNDSTYFAGGNSGTLIKTSNYGETWEKILVPFTSQITSLALKNNELFIGLRKKSQDSLLLYKYNIDVDTVTAVDLNFDSFITAMSNVEGEIYIADYSTLNRLSDNGESYTSETVYSNSESIFIAQKIFSDADGIAIAGYEGFNLGKVITGIPNNPSVKNFTESIYFNTGIMFENKLIVAGGDEFEIAIRENNNWDIIKLK